MRIDFVGHATLLIRQGDLALLSDPWWSGPAYRDQWYPYPTPVPERYDLSRVDAVYISHSHEDHLHAPTLRELLTVAPEIQAIIPLRADTSMRDYLQRIGFRSINEVGSGSRFTLRKGRDRLRLTLFTHVDDSLLAVEARGETLLNLNDALHSSRREMILEYARILRRRFPKLDYLFCGFGGASYFPNCVHVPGKEDLPVARARERFFLQNFRLIAELLKPRMAFPFAAHFVLPDARNWWISAARLQLEAPSETLGRLAPATPTDFHDLEPGDYVENGQVHSISPAHSAEPEVVLSQVRERYGSIPTRPPLDDAGFEALTEEIRQRTTSRSVPSGFEAVIVLTDYAPNAIRLHEVDGYARVETIESQTVGQSVPQLRVETRSDLIRSTLRSPFGKDLISIGYGGQFYARSTADLTSAPHDRLLQVLAPAQLRWRQQLREHPFRTFRYVLGDPSMRYAIAKRVAGRIRGSSTERNLEPAPYEMRDWVAVPEA